MTGITKHELCTNGSGFFDPTMGEVLLRLENEREIEQQKRKVARKRDNSWMNMLVSGNYKTYEPPKTPITAA